MREFTFDDFFKGSPEKDLANEQDIAIVGIALNVPHASTIDEFWTLLANGISTVNDLPDKRKKDCESYYNQMRMEDTEYLVASYMEAIDQFDYDYFKYLPREAEYISPLQRLYLETTIRCIEDAGYACSELNDSETGVFLGHIGDLDGNQYAQMLKDTIPKHHLSMTVAGNLSSVIASRVAHFLNLTGPTLTIDTACSSSLVALHTACQSILNGECEQALVGSIKLMCLPEKSNYKIGIESEDGQVRPFDQLASGTMVGEGCFCFLLKPLENARAQHDAIYGVIKGSAINQDGATMGITAPKPKAQEEVIVKAWKKARINPEEITYIETHGTGTKLGDPIEVKGIQEAFRRYTAKEQFCAIGSVKANVGHLYEASGLAGLTKIIAMIQKQCIPPLRNFKIPNEQIDFIHSPVYVCDKLTPLEEGKHIFGLSSFGLSGTNCHVVIENNLLSKKETSRYSVKEITRPYLFILSAKSYSALKHSIKAFINLLESNTQVIDLKNLCYTLAIGRDHLAYRFACVVHSIIDLQEKLKAFFEEEFPILKVASMQVTETISEIVQKKFEGEHLSFEVYKQLAEAYKMGQAINWRKFYANDNGYRMHLPSFPFEHKRCWYTQNITVNQKASIVLQEPSIKLQEANMLQGAVKVLPRYEIKQIISDIIKDITGIEKIEDSENLLELGGDSIILSRIYEEIDKRFPNQLEVAQMFLFKSIEDLVDCLFALQETPKKEQGKTEELGGVKEISLNDAISLLKDL